MSTRRFSRAEPDRELAPGNQPEWDAAALRSGMALRELLKRHRRRSAASEESGLDQPGQVRQPLDLRPGCVYGVVTRERVDDLTTQLREIRSRLNYLFSLVAGAIIIDVLLRISGLG